MGRDRGYWWAPDGARLLVARVDGKSPAEYLSDGERDLARAEGIRLILGRPGTLDRIWRGSGEAG